MSARIPNPRHNGRVTTPKYPRRTRGLQDCDCSDVPWVIHTSPGCDHPDHVHEVRGAMFALAVRGPWSGPSLMDCGCMLSVDQGFGL